MKKRYLVGLAAGVLMLGGAGLASATTIDNSAGWIYGSVNNGWYGSGQSLSIGAVETHFESIGFYFSGESAGRNFDFVLSDALNGGNTLFSTSFNVAQGLNVIHVDQDVAANSSVYALLDYNGFSGRTVYFSNDTYGGGDSSFGLLNNQTTYFGLDHFFVAELTNDTHATPEPATMLLLGSGLAGLIGTRRKKKTQA